MNIEIMFGGGYCEPSEIRKGGNGTGLTSFPPRLPKGGLRCDNTLEIGGVIYGC